MTVSFSPREKRSWMQAVSLSMLCLALQPKTTWTAEPPDWDLTPLEPAPEWAALDPWQRTVSGQEFKEELERIFLAAPGIANDLFQVFPDHALIAKQSKHPEQSYRFEFGNHPQPLAPVYWRAPSRLPPLRDASHPLQDLRIVIDPGHIGGEWARMEQRWFLIPDPPSPCSGAEGNSPQNLPVQEGNLVLRVAELLEQKLTAQGARVALVRRRLEPVTPLRPVTMLDSARKSLGLEPNITPDTNTQLRAESERLFYLSAEIRARGQLVNREFRPDLAVCLHMNAEAWGNPAQPSLTKRNHFHILINGCYTRAELMKDDQRFLLMHRLVQGIHREEVALAETVAEIMAPRLGLPPYEYLGGKAKHPGTNPFVWSRNLLATRIYSCPVIYFEPYVMNDEVTYARIQAGEYEGTRSILGVSYPNLFEEYAAGVAEGLVAYYNKHRSPPSPTPVP